MSEAFARRAAMSRSASAFWMRVSRCCCWSFSSSSAIFWRSFILSVVPVIAATRRPKPPTTVPITAPIAWRTFVTASPITRKAPIAAFSLPVFSSLLLMLSITFESTDARSPMMATTGVAESALKPEVRFFTGLITFAAPPPILEKASTTELV